MNIPGNTFVIQEHTTPADVHWDLMLQFGDVLWTWRLGIGPGKIQDTPVPAEKIADHPMRFLSYEGPVQNHTGSVYIADSGSFSIFSQTEREISFETAGRILKGSFMLTVQKNNLWLLSRVR
jgi:hypothetical protein